MQMAGMKQRIMSTEYVDRVSFMVLHGYWVMGMCPVELVLVVLSPIVEHLEVCITVLHVEVSLSAVKEAPSHEQHHEEHGTRANKADASEVESFTDFSE